MGIIVTGGSGFIGSALVEYLLNKYPDEKIINISKHTYVINPNVLKDIESNPNYVFVPLDICNSIGVKEIIEKYNVDKIFHIAAETHVDRSFIYPLDFLQANVIGTFSLLEMLRYLKNKPKFLYMSTDECFGDVPRGFCKEDDCLSPRNPYSASKAAAEAYCNAYYHSFKVPVITARDMNNFGPRQHPEKLIPKIITNCILNRHFTLFEGESIRGWIYVHDTASALDCIMNKGNIGEIYHISATVYKTVPEVANIILKMMNKEKLFDGFKGRRLKDDERYALDGSKVTNTLGWNYKYTFEEGIDKTIEWYKKNEWFWRIYL